MKSLQLGDLCDENLGFVQTGPFGSQLHQADYREEGVAVVMPKDIVDGGICKDSISYIEISKAQSLSKHIVKAGDIIYPRRGDIAKRAFITNEDEGALCGTGCLLIRLRSSKLDSRYLYFYLAQPEVIEWIAGRAVGATMLNLNTKILRALDVFYPALTEQKKVVDVLLSIDELVNNNQRRITLLEQAARRIYTEWFVRMRFPGHEQCQFVDGVPEGWQRGVLSDLVTLNYGKSLKKSNRIDGNVPVYGSNGIVGHHDSPLVQGPCIIIGRKGNVGSMFYSHVSCFPIDTVFYISKAETSFYLYLSLGRMNFISSDAAVPGLNRNYAYSQPILIPDDTVLSHFECMCDDFYKQIDVLGQQNQKLRQARDLLLPKLMSGQIKL